MFSYGDVLFLRKKPGNTFGMKLHLLEKLHEIYPILPLADSSLTTALSNFKIFYTRSRLATSGSDGSFTHQLYTIVSVNTREIDSSFEEIGKKVVDDFIP